MSPLPNSDSFSTYGGQKVNYSQPVNSSTDYDASNLNAAFASTAEMTRTAVRGFVRFVAGVSPALAASNSYESVWRADTTTLPIIAQTGTGVYTVTLPASVKDPLQTVYTTNLRAAFVQIEGVGTVGFAQCSVTSANVITVYLFNSSAAANNLSGVTIGVYFL